MTVFRVAFVVISAAAVAATGYVAYYGYGSESGALKQSVRIGSSGGGYYRTNRVK